MLYGGIYRGTVAGGGSMGSRVQVTVPTLDATLWAQICLPPDSRANYQAGDDVWVMFEGGKVNFPVVVGASPTGA